MHCKKSFFLVKKWSNSLGKITQNQGQLSPLPKSGGVLHGTYPKRKLF